MRLFELFKLKGKPAIIKCERFNGRGTIPTRAHVSDAGLDLYSPENIILLCDAVHVVDTMIRVEIPAGYFGLILPRSSTSGRGVHVYTSVIDSGYRGTLKIQMSNILNHPVKGFKKGERIAQLVILPKPSADSVGCNSEEILQRFNARYDYDIKELTKYYPDAVVDFMRDTLNRDLSELIKLKADFDQMFGDKTNWDFKAPIKQEDADNGNAPQD